MKSMHFLCMYCNNANPVALSITGFDYHDPGSYATGFFICPECKNKFMVKIQDLGKVRDN